MTVQIPSKRKVKFDIDGKLFEVKELSMAYLMEATVNPESDTMDAAIEDAMGHLNAEDYKHFGAETKALIYAEIVKFTFKEALSKEQKKETMKAHGLKAEEFEWLSKEAQVQLWKVMEGRKPVDASKKKPSPL